MKFLILLLLCLPGLAAAASLRQALDAAWARAPSLRGLEAGQAEAGARRAAADHLFPGTPALGLGQRSGAAGKSEFEMELATPLWLPGQRQASLAYAAAQMQDNAAAQTARRWVLAGELRNLVAAAQAAQAERDQMRARLENDRQLAEEVARRVAAGDLARSDLLLARGEALASETALLEAESRLTRALRDYRVLTGLEALPTAADEALAPAVEPHPALLSARQNLDSARAGLELARRSQRDAPELAVQVQRARDVNDPEFRNNLRFGLRIPFSTDARNQPLLAAAQGDIGRAEAELARTVAELDAELATAQGELALAEQARELAQARQAAATERLLLVKKGFDLGELPLAQLLLARVQGNEADAAAIRARQQVAAARARVNQARGVLP